MFIYITKRLLLMIPTLIGVMLITFLVTQFVPGGPVEQLVQQLQGKGQGGEVGSGAASFYRGHTGLDKQRVDQLKALYGFDKPAPTRFFEMMKRFAVFDLGDSYYHHKSVWQLVKSKLPVSISIGVWTFLIVYMVCIPLGIAKAVRDGSRFDVWTSGAVIFGNAIPGFLFAILLIVVFAGGRYLDWFPLRGLVSDNWSDLSWPMRIVDYFWHMTLPIVAIVIGSFAGLTMLTKNSFLDQIHQQYVVTARAKGLGERAVLYGHVFRNAMLIVIAGFPAAFIGLLFTSSLLIEVIFSLDGLGLLGFEAAIDRDYPVMFGTLYMFTLLGLVMQLVGDITYTLVDPRIDFESREV